MQEMILIMRLIQSRQEYLNIIKHGKDERRRTKAKNQWPGRIPYGYTKNKNRNLERVEKEAEVIQRGVELVIRGDEEHDVPVGVVAKAHSQLKEEFDEEELLLYGTLLDLLRKMYTGKLI
jgi:hypothetical protein